MTKERKAFKRITEYPVLITIGGRGSGKSEMCRRAFEQRVKDKELVEDALKALEIIKKCFDVNGLDELIPNQHWWKLPITKRNKLLKEMFK